MYFLSEVAILINIAGLALLHKQEDKNIRKTQKQLIISLSLTEVSLLIASAVEDYILKNSRVSQDFIMFYFNYMLTVLGQMYYVSMFGITVDRFLEIRLNVKYGLYLSAKKARLTLLAFFTILNLIYFTYLVLVVTYERYELTLQVQLNFQKYITPLNHITFIITAFSVYFYIFRRIHKNRKEDERLKRNVSSNAPVARQKFCLVKYLVPLWIIISFVLFVTIPNVMIFIYYAYSMSRRETLRDVIAVLFEIGCIADPLIYIYHLEIVRKRMRKVRANISNSFSK